VQAILVVLPGQGDSLTGLEAPVIVRVALVAISKTDSYRRGQQIRADDAGYNTQYSKSNSNPSLAT